MATLKNTIIDDTGYIQLPVGTTAQRPVSPVAGMVRFNTTLGYLTKQLAYGKHQFLTQMTEICMLGMKKQRLGYP